MINVYGLKNCDTCRNAMKWLNNSGLMHEFHDVRETGVDAEAVGRWARAVGWESLLNRRSTTWRNLPDDVTEDVDETRALALLVENPTLIKRPVFERAGEVHVGFKDIQRQALMGAS